MKNLETRYEILNSIPNKYWDYLSLLAILTFITAYYLGSSLIALMVFYYGYYRFLIYISNHKDRIREEINGKKGVEKIMQKEIIKGEDVKCPFCRKKVKIQFNRGDLERTIKIEKMK